MLTRVLRGVRLDSINQRSQVGVQLRRIREDLTDMLGGDVTPAERILVDQASKSAIICQAVSDHILRQSELTRPRGDLLPVVVQHATLIAQLARVLSLLGLKRAAREVTVADQAQALLGERANGRRSR